MKKAIIYIRVSDPSQIDNNSLEVQEKACIRFAENKGYEIVKPVFREEGKSAKNVHGRPKLREAISFSTKKSNRINALIVYKFDRFSRNLEEGLATITLLAKYGVEVLSVTEDVEQGPMGTAIRNIMMVVGQLDNELKGERVKENMMSAFRKGLWVFKCPVGYKRKYKTKEESKGLPPVQDKNLAPIISMMFKKASTGVYNKTQLAREMNLSGFGSYYKSKASHKIVDNILKKTFYYGKMYAPKWDEYAWGKHQPLIDEQIWQQAYHKVILKKKNYSYQDDTIYPLKGTLRCDLCNHQMTTSPSTGNSGKVYYYECGGCRKVRIQANKAHEQFEIILRSIKPSPIVVKLFTNSVISNWDRVIKESERQASDIDSKIKSLKNELRNIRKAEERGTYSTEEAIEETAEVRKEIAILKIERSDIRIEQYNAEIVREFIEQFFMNFDQLWDRLGIVKKQALQNKIFPNGILCLKSKEIRTNELSPSFQLIEALGSEKGENVTPRGIEPRFSG